MVYRLILLRHGQSEWNEKNLFTGWVDVRLSERGRAEAADAGRLMKREGIAPDVLHTSLLQRAITTANLALEQAELSWIPVRRSWRLNERHYGALQGKDKAQVLADFGEDQFKLWRRSYDVPPPQIAVDGEFSQKGDSRYVNLGEDVPRTECLKDVLERLIPYWEDAIIPELRAGQTVLITAHGNSLRALVKRLDRISDEDIASLNIPTGIPLLYELDGGLQPITRGGRYLDAEAAASAIAAVADQGKGK